MSDKKAISRRVDAFITIKGYDHDNHHLIVSAPKLMEPGYEDQTVRLFIPKKSGAADTSNYRWSGSDIDQRMESVLPSGTSILVQSLSIPLERKLTVGDIRPCSWIYKSNQDKRRQISGALSFKGIFHKDQSKRTQDKVMEVGYWHTRATIPESSEFESMLGMIDERYKRIAQNTQEPVQLREVLPYLGVMMRTELGDQLVEYSKPIAKQRDIDITIRNNLPITINDIKSALDQYQEAAHKRYGNDARVSIMRYSTFLVGNSIKQSQSFRYRHAGTFAPIKSKHDPRQYLGGHYAINRNAAMSITPDRNQGRSIITMYPEHIAASSSPSLTALYAKSPYTNEKLNAATHIDRDVPKYRYIKENDSSKSQISDKTENISTSPVKPAKEEEKTLKELQANPPVDQNGKISLEPYMAQQINKDLNIVYLGLERNISNGSHDAKFMTKDNKIRIYKQVDLKMLIENYEREGISSDEQQLGLKMIRTANFAQQRIDDVAKMRTRNEQEPQHTP